MTTTQTFSGIDASNEISLIEYGLLVSDQEHEDGSGTRFCIYRIGEGFGTGHFSEKDINYLLNGKDWADENSLSSFYSFIGVEDRSDYVNSTSFTMKMHDLISFYGHENICGIDYSPMSEKEARERYLN